MCPVALWLAERRRRSRRLHPSPPTPSSDASLSALSFFPTFIVSPPALALAHFPTALLACHRVPAPPRPSCPGALKRCCCTPPALPWMCDAPPPPPPLTLLTDERFSVRLLTCPPCCKTSARFHNLGQRAAKGRPALGWVAAGQEVAQRGTGAWFRLLMALGQLWSPGRMRTREADDGVSDLDLVNASSRRPGVPPPAADRVMRWRRRTRDLPINSRAL